MARISIDRYVVDSLMPDLVGHDRQPSAFLVYLYLWCRGAARGTHRVAASLQQVATDTGLSKSAVQDGLRRLKRRRLVKVFRESPTAIRSYRLDVPWRRTATR